jgi:hypothetical protein
VNRKDHARPRRNGFFDLLGFDLKRILSAIHEDRPGFEIEDDLTRRRKCHGGQNDFIAFANAQCCKGKMESGGTRTKCNRMTSADVAQEGRLELSNARACRQPPALKNSNNGFNFLLTDEGVMVRQKGPFL